MGNASGPSAGVKRYACLSLTVIFTIGIYLVTREKHSDEDITLTKIYEEKYKELELMLLEKDKALNETYTALQKTYSANQLQEESVKELQLRLQGIQAELKKKGGLELDLHKATMQGSFLTEDKNQAVMTTQMCRQEAAAAVQEKENIIWQHQQALERAREDVEELQKAVKIREGSAREKELASMQQMNSCTQKLHLAINKLEDRERSLHWMVEKKRTDNENHAQAVVSAKTERDCHNDITILREELNKALSKQQQKDIISDIQKNHQSHSKGGWLPTSQLPEVGLPAEKKKETTSSSSTKKAPSVNGKQNAWIAAHQNH
mmetsp:Transcript_22553/g.31400  ORF Transcript_22553/g.31400 Transcript_22553/m.31400 type:complete len:320 (+) Transcript_22553:111-1070(+)|eukprot:CAMPEP_0196583346 /NCGR_PEP_ID=MMETSP1081-20130531/43117_1 /TAXON_ID=36882 /ORGANISM="Pyramimonas amylifera, Strain CCMP720" /LENGTH=319 /DNA_ID=CAMNT_0041904195 /DNA_START=107 /DNA_END=1066 /DNA_ORIENTATION=-